VFLLIGIYLIIILITLKSGISSRNFAKNKKEELRFSKEKIKKFKVFNILTNKNWIQKGPYFIDIDFSTYPKDSVQRYNDIIFVKLDLIDLIRIKTKEYTMSDYRIEFYINYKEFHPIQADFYVSLNNDSEEYKKLVKILKDKFSFEKLEYEEVGFWTYSCRKKN